MGDAVEVLEPAAGWGLGPSGDPDGIGAPAEVCPSTDVVEAGRVPMVLADACPLAEVGEGRGAEAGVTGTVPPAHPAASMPISVTRPARR